MGIHAHPPFEFSLLKYSCVSHYIPKFSKLEHVIIDGIESLLENSAGTSFRFNFTW